MPAPRPNAACADRILDAFLTRLECAPGFTKFLSGVGEQEELDLLVELKDEVERVLDRG